MFKICKEMGFEELFNSVIVKKNFNVLREHRTFEIIENDQEHHHFQL